MRALLDNQVKAIDKLSSYKVGALFMEPGTGKTRAAYELIKSVSNIDYLLYLAPYQAINTDNYHESVPAEIERCGGFDIPVDFIGFESLSSSDSLYLDLIDRLNAASKPFIIADESIKIKNLDAIRTKRILQLSQLADYKLILNGTPISRNLLDLWSQMEFLSPKILRMKMPEYKNTFCEYTVMTKRIGRQYLRKEWINKYHNLDYLFSLIGPFVFDSALDIEAKIQYVDINYQLTAEEMQEHDWIKFKYLDDETLELKNSNIFLEITQKLQHNYSLSPQKFSIVDHILKQHDPGKVLICAKFINTQQALKTYFPNVRVISWQKNSFALNLQAYNVIIKWDKHWDYALHDQLKHRVYRTGQTDDCVFYDLTGNVGIETMMNKNAESKGTLLNAFMRKSVKELQKEL